MQSAAGRTETTEYQSHTTSSANSVEEVGSLIAEEYALMYRVPRNRVLRAGLLRAEAASLRDRVAERPDWSKIGRLLRESYSSLRAAVEIQ